jgi:signal transduction histidine kinase
MRTPMQDKRVALQMRLSQHLPPIQADKVQLQQVILNLMVNAMDAMSGADEPLQLSIESSPGEPGRVVVQVTDTGRGLDPAALKRIFDPFYTTKPEGMGMGLAISRSIIEGHGGKLWASVNSPRGAIFSFSLPVGP